MLYAVEDVLRREITRQVTDSPRNSKPISRTQMNQLDSICDPVFFPLITRMHKHSKLDNLKISNFRLTNCTHLIELVDTLLDS